MNRTAESNLALALGISRAYQPFLSDSEAESIRDEHERRQALLADWRDDRDESKRYRSRSAIVSWLVGACLVGLGIVLAAIVWAS